MQADTISRLQNMSSIVKTPSPLSGLQHHQQKQSSSNAGQLDNIFNSVKRQIDQWGENAKWKIDLVLLDNPSNNYSNTSNSNNSTNSLHPLLSPQHLHANVITTSQQTNSSHQGNNNKYNSGDSIGTATTLSLPVTSTIQYPWDYVAPTINDWRQNSDDLQQKLRESIERQKYLESVIWSQAEQIKHSSIIPDKDNAINTMKSIFLMSQNEQRMHYLLESNLLHKDIETLSRKAQKMASILTSIEQIEITEEEQEIDREQLLNDRKILLRKLHLSELRLSARDAEIDYLHEVIDTLKQQHDTSNSPSISSKKLRKGPPYLFQQQYSPRSSEVRQTEQHPLSGLDSLGIVADQMLSDPEFETTTVKRTPNEKRLRTRLDDRRSQRSIDSATTLLAMPKLMNNSHRTSSPSSSPEAPKQSLDHHIPKKPRSTYTRWTEAEDNLLRAAVQKYGHSNWEACSKDVTGRSNIQCRNRWIRHLEHRAVPKEVPIYEEPEPIGNSVAHSSNNNDARQSPSIAALLNDEGGNSSSNAFYSPRSTPKQVYDSKSSTNSGRLHLHPPSYRPPSPMATPKNGKRRSPDAHQSWS